MQRIVWSVLLYTEPGLSKQEMKEAGKLRNVARRRMEKISWVKRISNEEVLRRRTLPKKNLKHASALGAGRHVYTDNDSDVRCCYRQQPISTMSVVVNDQSSPPSRVLFLSETGRPMRFYLRPGATKAQLLPIITAGGGVVCRVQEPDAILLLDPEEINVVPVHAATRYVSSQYILDCVEKNQQLEVDDYRFKDDSVQIGSAKSKREGSGRMGYTSEEDAAILGFVRGRLREVNGNRLWKEMEREAVTSHSWQSMRDRYRKHLAKQPLGSDTEERQKADAMEGPSMRSFTIPLRQKGPTLSSHPLEPPPHSTDEAALKHSPEGKTTNSSPERTRPQPSTRPTSPRPLPENPHPQRSPDKIQPHPSPGRTPPLTPANQPRPQSAAEVNFSPAVSKRTNPLIILDRIQQSASPRELKLRTLAGEGCSAEKNVAGPSTNAAGTNQQLVVVKQAASDNEPRPPPKKRKLGILERAVREFEDISESDDDTPDMVLGNTTHANDKVSTVTTLAEFLREDNDAEDSNDDENDKNIAESPPEKAPDVQPDYNSQVPDVQPDSDQVTGVQDEPPDKERAQDDQVETLDEDDAPDLQQKPPDKHRGPEDRGPVPKTSAPMSSKVHLFIFDRESQEEGPSLTAYEPTFSQAQVEHTKQQLRYLMRESRQSLDAVTKALLKSSGNVQAALQYLLHGCQSYLWDPRDDGLLCSAGASLLSLEEKYGKEAVARRIAFLDIE
ncbi:hypothetical protein GJAV_G00174720 [Gymnothorax javanicus]|nr:hypothetical protein GJAV_G00174720 [Gymnothorax javanicus]